MLTVFPVCDRDEKDLYCGQSGMQVKDAEVLLAQDGEVPLGYIIISVQAGIVHALELKHLPNYQDGRLTYMEIAELLLRGAMSYGLNRNCYVMQSEVRLPGELLSGLGFTFDATGTMSTIISPLGCGGEKKKQC